MATDHAGLGDGYSPGNTMNCPFCKAPSVSDNGQGHFVCGAWIQGAMWRKGAACDYIASLSADLTRVLATTHEDLSKMVEQRVRELMGK